MEKELKKNSHTIAIDALEAYGFDSKKSHIEISDVNALIYPYGFDNLKAYLWLDFKETVGLLEQLQNSLTEYLDFLKQDGYWINFDNSKPKTYPENLRKVWLISDQLPIEEETIAYFDGGFYRNTEDWQIEPELLISGVRWCYVQRPPKP